MSEQAPANNMMNEKIIGLFAPLAMMFSSLNLKLLIGSYFHPDLLRVPKCRNQTLNEVSCNFRSMPSGRMRKLNMTINDPG